MAAPRVSVVLAALVSLAVLVGGAAQAGLLSPRHEPSSAASAVVAGTLRKPPIVRTATRKTTARKAPSARKARLAPRAQRVASRSRATARQVVKVGRALRAGKTKPKGRILRPRPGAARKRTPVPAAEAAPAAPNDPLWASSWSLSKVNAQAAWKLSAGSPDTVVAVLDTGADLRHPDLEGAFVPGYDFVNHDDDPSDDHGHGTMVAGVIAARANNGIGGAGTCTRCSVMPVKVIAGSGSGNASDVAQGIVWAADHGADVLNLSFVLSGPDDGVANAVAYARSRGIVVVAAAGNAGTSDVAFPAALPGVISVTGTDAADARYDWANYGSWVRLAAPGCNLATTPAGGYGDFCGTSSAAAFVSGLAGLARSFAANASAETLEEALAANAAPVGSAAARGRVDAAGILGALVPAPAPAARADA